MFAYIIVLLMVSVFTVIDPKCRSKVLWALTFIVYLVFIGLRHETGSDWYGYLNLHEIAHNRPIMDILTSTEPLSYLLFKTSASMGFSSYFSNLVAAFILLSGVFSFATKTYNRWVALIAATPYLIFVMGMSGIRQAMAAGIILFALAHWKKLFYLKRGGYILAAAMFHTSALINGIFLITQLHIRLSIRFLLGLALGGITYYLAFNVPTFSESMLTYQQRYIESADNSQSLGSLFHIILIVIPATLAFIYSKKARPQIHNQKLPTFGLLATLGVLILNFLPFLSTTLASRLTVYMYFLPMMVYPALLPLLGHGQRSMMASLIIVFHLLIVAVWFQFGNNSHAFVPYQNVLFSG